jgi:hypothetical protein
MPQYLSNPCCLTGTDGVSLIPMGCDQGYCQILIG